jgi:hypothetical protein
MERHLYSKDTVRRLMRTEYVDLHRAVVELLADFRLFCEANGLDFFEVDRSSYAAYWEMRSQLGEAELERHRIPAPPPARHTEAQ